LILFSSFGLFSAILASFINRIEKLDDKMSQISPYSTLADWVNVHAQSGLRIKIPKPIYIQVAKDCLSSLERAKYWLEDLLYDTDLYEKTVKLDKEETIPNNQNRSNIDSSHEGHKTTNLVKSSEGGASLLYVVTFCSSLFGSEAGLSYCRNQLITKCSIDILSWFDKNPTEDQNGGKELIQELIFYLICNIFCICMGLFNFLCAKEIEIEINIPDMCF